MPEQERKLLSDSALGPVTDGLIRVFYGPRFGQLLIEAGSLVQRGQYELGDSKSEEARTAQLNIKTFTAEMRLFVDRLERGGVPLPPREAYDQMIAAPTMSIGGLTAENLADNLPSQVLQAALDLLRVREGAAAGRIEGEPEAAAQLPEVLVNSVDRLVRVARRRVQQIPETDFEALKVLAAAGPNGFTSSAALVDVGLRFNRKPESFASRVVFRLRKVLEKNYKTPELIITSKPVDTQEGGYITKFDLREAKLKKPQPEVSPVRHTVERVSKVREVALVDREQRMLEVVLAAQAKGGATKKDLFEIPGVTPENLAWVKSRLSEKLEKNFRQGRIINIGSSSEPRYVQASVSTDPAPAAAPADEVAPPAPKLTSEDLVRSPELAVISPQEFGFLAKRLAGHPNLLTIANDADRDMVEKSAAGVEAPGDVNFDNLAVKLSYYLENPDVLDKLSPEQVAIVTMAALLEADYGDLFKE